MFVWIVLLVVLLYLIYLVSPKRVFPKYHYNPSATYLFWTGGMDSTFRLCQLLLDQKKVVQPVYLTMLDVDAPLIDPVQHRRNRGKEIQTMNSIRKLLFQKYPHTRRLLLPTLYADRIPDMPRVQAKAIYIHQHLRKFARPFTQYERMARFSLFHPAPAFEVGLENCGTGLDNATREWRIGFEKDCRLRTDLPKKQQPLLIFRKFRYPMVHLTKKQYVDIARKNGYLKMLKMSWSCWFPKRGGKPCGRCEMCQKRIKL